MAKIINGKLIESSMDFKELIDQIAKYYVMLKEEKVAVTNRLFSTKDGGLHIIGGATNFETESYIAMAQTVMPWRGEKGLPVATTSYIYSSYRTAEIKAIMGGADIVKYRTPAKSALAAKYLAPKKKEYTLGLIGLGIQAVTHAQALSAIFNVTRIIGHSRTPEKWQHNIDAMKSKLGKEVELLSKEELLKEADIVVVVTSFKAPLVNFADLHKGQLIIGTDHADTVAKDVVINADKTFIDYRPTAENENAAVKMLLEEGKKYEDIVDGDLLQLASGELKGRESDDEIIFFQSLGVMNENLAAAEYLYEKVGDKAQEVEF
jgi:ornithine cyclodeaminase/alanine dehydrogenase-like protein (mu-crystallin family)